MPSNHPDRSRLVALVAALAATVTTPAIAASTKAASTEDPYLWLEATHDPKALAWSAKRTAAVTAELKAKPLYAQLEAELRSVVAASAPAPSYFVLGDKLVRLRKDSAVPHGVLEVSRQGAQGASGSWRTVLDVGALRAKEGKPYELVTSFMNAQCLAPEYDRCLLSLSPAGADDVEFREFDLVKGAFVDGGFRTQASRAQAAWIGPDKVVIGHTEAGSPKLAGGWAQAIRLWSRDTSAATAPIIYTAERTDSLVMISALGKGPERRAVLTRLLDYQTFALGVVDSRGKLAWADLPRKIKPFGLLATTNRHLVVQLAQPATIAGTRYAEETLLAYDTDPATPVAKRASVIVPAGGDLYFSDILGFAGVGDDVWMIGDRRLQKRIIAATPTAAGWKTREAIVAPAGEALGFAGEVAGAEAVILRRSGFTTPARTELIARRGESRVLHDEPPVMDLSAYRTEIRSTKSKDGTALDYYLLLPKAARPGKPVPTLMTGYGAFGFSSQPGYFDDLVGSRSFALWLKRGGALALAISRGGGERGAAWHHAGARRNRQNSYDDFIAVAEALVKSGFTDRNHLGVFGSSAGGLLAATVAVQRPDLFGASVSDAPVLDMVRYTKMGIGGGMIAEFGDPDDPVERAILAAHSPYHNLRRGVAYPPIMVTISTEDNRVGAGHSRKFTARLEEIGGKPLLLEFAEGGHGMSDPVRNTPLMAMRMTFLIDTLMR